MHEISGTDPSFVHSIVPPCKCRKPAFSSHEEAEMDTSLFSEVLQIDPTQKYTVWPGPIQLNRLDKRRPLMIA